MRLEGHLSILNRVDDTPAVGGDARVEAHVDVGLADVAAEDEHGAGLLRDGVAVTHRVQEHAWMIDQDDKSSERRIGGGGGTKRGAEEGRRGMRY